MDWLPSLFDGSTVAGTLVIVSLVAIAGLALGQVQVRGVRLGVAGVLFAGLAFGHFGIAIDEKLQMLLRDFGLVLFVYTIGMQVGPGILSLLRGRAVWLNGIAASIVGLGVALCLAAHYIGGIDAAAAVGIMSGAATNTPGLAAAQQAVVAVVPGSAKTLAQVPGLGYAVAYPFGVLGTILVMIFLRFAFRIDVREERANLDRTAEEERPRVERRSLEVTNPNLDGMRVSELSGLMTGDFVISRLHHVGEVGVARPESIMHINDVLLAVGPHEVMERLRIVVGRDSTLDLSAAPSRIMTRRLIVTHKQVAGQTLAELDFAGRFGAQITRISRAEIEMNASPRYELQYGDTVLVVGEEQAIRRVASEIGDSPRSLDYPHLIPMFFGLFAGFLLGSWPIEIPGMVAPVKLGLAGGPLIVAIILSRIGKIGPLIWYMPMSANFMLREIGLVFFLTAVGLQAGSKFVATVASGSGLQWLAWGAAITLVPLLVVSVISRLRGLNFVTLSGVLAGSMTAPAALAFANNTSESEHPSNAYATVYPLTMILRVVAAQVVTMLLLP